MNPTTGLLVIFLLIATPGSTFYIKIKPNNDIQVDIYTEQKHSDEDTPLIEVKDQHEKEQNFIISFTQKGKNEENFGTKRNNLEDTDVTNNDINNQIETFENFNDIADKVIDDTSIENDSYQETNDDIDGNNQVETFDYFNNGNTTGFKITGDTSMENDNYNNQETNDDNDRNNQVETFDDVSDIVEKITDDTIENDSFNNQETNDNYNNQETNDDNENNNQVETFDNFNEASDIGDDNYNNLERNDNNNHEEVYGGYRSRETLENEMSHEDNDLNWLFSNFDDSGDDRNQINANILEDVNTNDVDNIVIENENNYDNGNEKSIDLYDVFNVQKDFDEHDISNFKNNEFYSDADETENTNNNYSVSDKIATEHEDNVGLQEEHTDPENQEDEYNHLLELYGFKIDNVNDEIKAVQF